MNPSLRLFDRQAKRYTLSEKLGEGGEGTVHTVAEDADLVAKIYHPRRRDTLRHTKLRRLLDKGLTRELALKTRIAFPLEILYDERKRFVGYLMPRVAGIPLKTAFFSRKRLGERFPDLRRRDLAAYARHFVLQLDFLHRHGILVGDINPLNLLVDPDAPTRGWIIDADSFQVDELPCPVGTEIFTPPSLQGCSFGERLRSPEDEHFSMAIMIFMILMLGKHPYSRIGGESPAANIRERAFPYPDLHGKMTDVPPGIWQFIWSHFDRGLKEGFHDVFARDLRYDTADWLQRLQKYHYNVSKGYFSDEIAPLSYRALHPVRVRCHQCERDFELSEKFVARLKSEGKKPLCSLCREKIRAATLARQSLRHSDKRLRRQRIRAAVGARAARETAAARAKQASANPYDPQTIVSKAIRSASNTGAAHPSLSALLKKLIP
jgi:serine/threonine protein kinase